MSCVLGFQFDGNEGFTKKQAAIHPFVGDGQDVSLHFFKVFDEFYKFARPVSHSRF